MRFNILSVDELGMTKVELTNILKNYNVYIKSVEGWVEAEHVLKNGKHNINAIVWTINFTEEKEFDSIKLLKSNVGYKHIPVIIISQFTDKKYIIKAIELGAVEYIVKPYNEETVISKLCSALGIPFEKAVDDTLNEDIVTYTFREMFNKEIRAASRGGYPFSMILVSVEPEIKGTKNQEEISSIINLVNKINKTSLRETDTIFLYTEDSIIFLLPFTDGSGVKIIEEKIKSIYNNHSMIKQKNNGYSFVSASVTYPDDGKIKEKLLEKLEDKFYEKMK